MKKAIIILLVLILTLSMSLLVACQKEVVYVYVQVNGGGVDIDNNPGGGNTPAVDPTDDGSTYNLTVWCAEEDVEMIEDMLDRYKDLHSANTYNFKVQEAGEDVVSSKVTTDINAAGDIFSFANDQLGILRNQNALYQIPTLYKAQIEQQMDVAITACSENGNYYGIPYSYENCFLYYNKSLVSENDVKNLETLLSKSVAGVDANLGIDMEDSYYTTMFMYTAGMEIFGKNGTDAKDVNLANEYAIKGCNYIASLGSQGKLKSIKKDNQVTALKNNNIAAMISGPHMITQFKAALGDNFGVAILPTIKLDGKEVQLTSFSGVKMYGVSNKPSTVRSAKDTAEACRVAAFLANADNQQVRLNEREFCPTDYDLFVAAKESGIPTVEVVVNQSAYSKLKPGVSQMSVYWTPMANFLNGVYKLTKPAGTNNSEWLKELKSIEDKIKES